MLKMTTSKLLGAALVATAATSANAAVTWATNVEDTGSTPSMSVASDDLLQSEFVSVTGDARYPGDGSGSTGPVVPGVLRDGSWGAWQTVTDSVGLQNPNVLTFTLDTSVNTLGYDITSIVSSAWWATGGNGRSDQRYAIWVSYVGDGGFSLIQPLTHFTSGMGPDAATQVTVTNNTGGVLDNGTSSTTGVDQIAFQFGDNDGTAQGGAGGGNNWNFYREIDVIGTATVPEPSSLALIGLSGLCMLQRRRK